LRKLSLKFSEMCKISKAEEKRVWVAQNRPVPGFYATSWGGG